MQQTRRTRLALLAVALTIVLSSAPITGTMGTLTDEEVIDGNDIEADTWLSESASGDENGSDTGDTDGTTLEEDSDNETEDNETLATSSAEEGTLDEDSENDTTETGTFDGDNDDETTSNETSG